MLEGLSGSRYLLTAYAVSSDAWENFRQTGQKAPLNAVAVSLCGAWKILAEDDGFFGALDEMKMALSESDLRGALEQPVGTRSTRGPGPPQLRDRWKFVAEFAAHLDVDTLLTREFEVLAHAGMEPAHAVSLVTDLRELLGDRLTAPSAPKMASLQQRVKELADQLCNAQETLRVFDYDPVPELEAGHAPHRRWVRILRLVGRGVRALAGPAGAVGNVAAAVDNLDLGSGFQLASVVGGVEAMSSGIDSILEPEPRAKRTPRKKQGEED
jgi:hypothetical protein